MSVAHPHYFLQPASQAVCLVKAKSIKVWGFSMTGALTILVPFLTKMYILSVLYSIAILLSRRSVVLAKALIPVIEYLIFVKLPSFILIL